MKTSNIFVDGAGTLARSRKTKIGRREPRYVASVIFKLQRFLRFGPVNTQAVTLDISMCGMSALVCGAPRVRETVVIELLLQGHPVEILATVRHSTNAKSGFEFYPLSPLAEHGVQRWIADLSSHEETEFANLCASAAKFGTD
ncbi:MAG: PilZ domain-containing protein [Terriglobales bacterium]